MIYDEPIPVDDLCPRCRKHPAEPLHACPYDVDVNNDPTPTCRCCEACEIECAGNV